MTTLVTKKPKKRQFALSEGCEVRGLMIKIYPTTEQDLALKSLERDNRSAWNFLVKQVEDVLEARQALAIREGLVGPRPTAPNYDGLEPTLSAAAKKRHTQAILDWRGAVHNATKAHRGCAYRSVKEMLANLGLKYDYQLLSRTLDWKTSDGDAPAVRPGASMLQAVAKNYWQSSARRKKFRKSKDAMPIQVRSGHCFEIGDFGTRRGKAFYNCQISLNGLKIKGRLPGRTPWGRVLQGVSITRKADGWWASIKQEVPRRQVPPSIPGTVVGIDVGLVLIAATSDGLKVENPRGAEYAERIAGRQALGLDTARIQLRASRQVKHTLYSRLLPAVAHYETIKVERLASTIGQMGSSKVSAMRVAKSMLEERYGDRVREVDCRYTSQDCSQCGVRSKESWSYAHGRYGQCPACGYSEDRDVNAARNIAARTA